MKSLLLLSLLPLALSAPSPVVPRQSCSNGTRLSFSQAVGAEIAPKRTTVSWTADDTDGTYVIQESSTNNLVFASIVTGANETFVEAEDLSFGDYYDYYIQPSRENVLFAANYTKQYRHSFFADYYIYNRDSGSSVPLVDDQVGDIAYAVWAPTGDTIAYVRGNDIYIWRNGTSTQITTDGGPDVFNGVPDWVYEEEIFGDRFTLWFSPDAEYVAFLRMNETGVPTFTVQFFMNNQKVAPQYPRELDIRYPKVSNTNPTVTFNLLDLRSDTVENIPFEAFGEETIITEVAWVAPKHEKAIFRAMNRVQDEEQLILVDVEAGSTSVVRERDGTDGWLDSSLAIKYVGAIANGTNSTEYYLDLSDASGWMHLYLYPVGSDEPIALTSGEFEVTSILKVDTARSLVYFLSTEYHSTSRHVYSVNLVTGVKTALVDDTTAGYWSASFSDEAGYYILSYNGPGIPWQKLYSTNSTNPLRTISDNAALSAKLATLEIPETRWIELEHPDGYTMNAIERLPAGFDESKQYPVLFDIYGGPGSQEVNQAWPAMNFDAYAASDPELEYIVVTVDNRGTGFKGREYRALVAKNLGDLESEDQVWAAGEWAKKSYVDAEHIAIWGWSYGGYLTSKVVERDANVFTLGLITAPVTDWRFYDSMYTERYMKTLELNAEGYNKSAVSQVAGFQNIAGGFLIQHGSADDNVHTQNSHTLTELLTREKVSPEKMRMRFFTDSDHSIRYDGANVWLYRQLSMLLFEEKLRVGEGGGHQWSRRGAERCADCWV